MNPLIQLKRATPLFLVVFVLGCLALSPRALAQLPSPTPDGGYPGQNTAEGDDALFSLTVGTNNTAIGFDALYNNTYGSSNTAIGSAALFNDTANGAFNTAVGSEALFNNTTGGENTATGEQALFNNTVGLFNTANGGQALYSNTYGNENTATGAFALYSNTNGSFNTATGQQALYFNSSGAQNTANGTLALRYNVTGHNNTAAGFGALEHNNTGSTNTATGVNALPLNTSGNSNTATGVLALYSNMTGNSNIALGFASGSNLTTGDNNIDIGDAGIAAESNTIRIGTQIAVTDVIGQMHPGHTAAFIAGIYQATVAKGLSVVVDSTGHLGTKGSAERFKDEIKPMDKASEAILGLKPVTFHYKKEFDPDGIPQFGLVAEDVAKVNPDLVARDDQGNIYTVRYDAVNAMLLNEFLKGHRKVEELKKDFHATLAQQQKEIQALTATMKEQALQIQKVSSQLEARNPAPRMVLNNQ